MGQREQLSLTYICGVGDSPWRYKKTTFSQRFHTKGAANQARKKGQLVWEGDPAPKLKKALEEIRREEEYRRKLCSAALDSPLLPKGKIENIAEQALAEVGKE